MVNKDDAELNINNFDEDIINEFKLIKSLGNERKDYPLIAEALTKIYTTDNKEKLALSNLNLVLRNNEIFALLG